MAKTGYPNNVGNNTIHNAVKFAPVSIRIYKYPMSILRIFEPLPVIRPVLFCVDKLAFAYGLQSKKTRGYSIVSMH